MDLGRSERRREARKLVARPANSSSFEPVLERLERQASIEAALQQLPGDQREVIVMKIWGTLTFSQIAEALNIPLNTAASRYRYAIAHLATVLAEEVACD